MVHWFADRIGIRRMALRVLCSSFFLFNVSLVTLPRSAEAAGEASNLTLLVETLRTKEAEPSVCVSLMRGMLSGLEGRRNLDPPDGWNELSERFGRSENADVRELSQKLSQIVGDRAASLRSLEKLKDRNADAEQRRSALRSLLDQQNDQVAVVLESLLDEPGFELDAIRGFASIGSSPAPSLLLNRYAKLAPELQRAVVETLASRKPYAEKMLEAIEQGKIARKDIPAQVARSLNEILGKQFVKVFGEVPTMAPDREQQIQKFKKMITSEALSTANASRGRAIFQKTCAACHLLYGEGGKVGPDLTGSNRANLDYILLNSVDPSYDVPDGYKTVQILTEDGRVVNGVLAEEDATRVVLKTAEQPRVVIAKQDIETRKLSSKSMMPDGQLDQMKPQEIVDLILYLRTTQQVELPK